MANRPIGANAKKLLGVSNHAAALLEEIGGDSLAGSGFETDDPDRNFKAAETVEPEPNAPEEE